MGLFSWLFGKPKNDSYTPNFETSEYDNWLNFIDVGGTSEQFEHLKLKNRWVFAEGSTETFMRYQAELKPITNKYFPGLEKLQDGWSVLYNLKDYSGRRAEQYIAECNRNIELYKRMVAIDKKFGHTSPPNAPAYKRLAMIYEKRGEFNVAIVICTEALLNGANGDGMAGRLIRMIKKTGRDPTPDELALLEIE